MQKLDFDQLRDVEGRHDQLRQIEVDESNNDDPLGRSICFQTDIVQLNEVHRDLADLVQTHTDRLGTKNETRIRTSLSFR
jgi:hypothetical protein